MSLRLKFLLTAGVLCIWALPGSASTVPTAATWPQDIAKAHGSNPWGIDDEGEPNLPRSSLQWLEFSKRVRSPFKVRQLGKDSRGSLVAESSHFRIVYDRNPDLMAKVAQVAEEVRLNEYRKWFGEARDEWDGKCTVYMYASHALYAKKTKQDGALAHFRPWVENGSVYRRSIHLPCDVPSLFEDVLPHEVTHSVLANGLQGRAPRWADEGMAVLAESPASLEKWREYLVKAWRKDQLFALEVLVRTDEAEQVQCVEYYSQSMSLVEFFVAARGRKTFIRFLQDSTRTSYEAALQKHYGIQSFADLNRRWLVYAFPVRRRVPSHAGAVGDLAFGRTHPPAETNFGAKE